jgi:small conductance mechanosensitive channel
MDEFNVWLKYAYDMVISYGIKVIISIPILFIGLWIIKRVTKIFVAIMEARNIDISLRPFLKNLVNILLKIMLIISVATMLGFEMTSFIAVLGAASLAIGMSLSGTLQNFAGGVIILLFRPFKVGDFIEAQGYTGTVYEIQIFNTLLKTIDNRVVFLPNGSLANSSLVNFSHQDTRRVDWTFSIAYGDNVDTARDTIDELLKQDDRVLSEPEYVIAVSALANSSVNFTVRAWVKSEDYWTVFWALNENVYKTFPQKGLHIPFPQMDVHIKQ